MWWTYVYILPLFKVFLNIEYDKVHNKFGIRIMAKIIYVFTWNVWVFSDSEFTAQQKQS
jgi:cytochrome b